MVEYRRDHSMLIPPVHIPTKPSLRSIEVLILENYCLLYNQFTSVSKRKVQTKDLPVSVVTVTS